MFTATDNDHNVTQSKRLQHLWWMPLEPTDITRHDIDMPWVPVHKNTVNNHNNNLKSVS